MDIFLKISFKRLLKKSKELDKYKLNQEAKKIGKIQVEQTISVQMKNND